MTKKKSIIQKIEEVFTPKITSQAYAIKVTVVAPDTIGVVEAKILADQFGMPILFRNKEVADAVLSGVGVKYEAILVNVTEI